jgi:hypothetical protein
MQTNNTMTEQLAELDETYNFKNVLDKCYDIFKETETPLSLRFQVMELLHFTYMQGYRHGKETTACIYQIGNYEKKITQNPTNQ